MDYLDSENTHVSGNYKELLRQLRLLAHGRIHATTQELARVTGHADQTIRKAHSQTGEFLGLRPIKVGNRLLWPLVEIALLLSDAGRPQEERNDRKLRPFTVRRKFSTAKACASKRTNVDSQKEGCHD